MNIKNHDGSDETYDIKFLSVALRSFLRPPALDPLHKLSEWPPHKCGGCWSSRKKQRDNHVDVLDAAAKEQGDGADRGCVRRDPMNCQKKRRSETSTKRDKHIKSATNPTALMILMRWPNPGAMALHEFARGAIQCSAKKTMVSNKQKMKWKLQRSANPHCVSSQK